MRRPRLAPLAVLLALAACAACGAERVLATAPGTPSEHQEGAFALRVATSVATVAAGDTLSATFTVTNTGPVPVTVVGSGTCGLRVELRDAGGATIPALRDVACTLDCRAYRFEPMRPVTIRAVLSTRPWSNAEQRPVVLQPGAYSVVGIVEGTRGGCAEGDAVRLISAPATFRIVP